MCLLFAGGVMNPVWIVAIAVYVLLEKVVPHGAAVTRLAGLALIGGGFWLVAA
jgi:predicted metal-binding membrane protein